MIIGITGHTNIEKATGIKLLESGEVYNQESVEFIIRQIELVLRGICDLYNTEFNDLTLVSGMARGVDEIFAEVAYRNQLKLILTIPNSIKWHKNRDRSRGVRAQAINYDRYLTYENTIEVLEIPKVYNGKVYKFANFARNQSIIDESNIVISYKSYDSAGTNDAIAGAKAAGKYFGNVPDLVKQLEDEIATTLF